MGVVHNLILGGGGTSLPTTLNVTVSGGTATTVTASLGSRSVSLTYDSTSALWSATLPKNATGNWTVTATGGSKTVSDLVAISGPGIWSMELTLGPLPSGYTELEYVEGSSPITIPNFQSTSDIGWEVDFSTTYSTTSAWYLIFDGFNSVNVNRIATGVYPRSEYGFGVWRGPTPSGQAMNGTYYSGRHVVSVSSSGNCYLDGVSFATNRGSPLAESFNLNIFNNITAKLYSLIFYHGSTEYLHFFPAIRDSDQKVGLYETVTSTFFYPASGNLSAGPEV